MNSELGELQSRFGPALRLSRDVPGGRLTTFGLGGPIALLAEPEDVQTLSGLLAHCAEKGIPWRILGAGSNVVIPDQGVKELVIRPAAGFSGWYSVSGSEEGGRVLFEGTKRKTLVSPFVLALAGASIMALSRSACASGWGGLEFAAGIPGSAGGALKMNAGAHGGSISSCVEAVYALSPAGELSTYSARDLVFGYRKTSLPQQSVVAAVLFRLTAGSAEHFSAERSRCLQYRKRTQPLHLPSAGSVFRNPSPESPAGRLLENAGLKGTRIGGVMYSEMHANWLVRVAADAKAADVSALVALGQRRVFEETGVRLEPEIILW